MDKTCDTCKHWGANPPSDSTGTHRYCNHRGMGIWSQDRIKPDSAYSIGAWKENEVIVPFMCGPKFGCVHWEKK